MSLLVLEPEKCPWLEQGECEGRPSWAVSETAVTRGAATWHSIAEAWAHSLTVGAAEALSEGFR